MLFLRKINKNMRPFINNDIFRYSHHDSLSNIPTFKIPKNKIIINLLGERKSVDIASWEIKGFASEKSLHTANIVYDNELLNHFLFKKTNLQFIVNRCYNIHCDKLLLLNKDIMRRTVTWQPYNLYVLPYATNRFTTCNFVQNCRPISFIIYPLESSEDIKRRDINIIIDN